MKNYILFATLWALTLLPSTAQETTEPRLTIVGEGVVHIVPDRVDLYFGFQSEGVQVDRVKRENDSLVASLLPVLKKLGIDKKDIQTQHLSLQKYYDHRQEKEMYRATQNFMVRIADLEDYPEITAVLLTSGVNQIDRVVFGHSNSMELEDRAREAAVKDALQKVALYSEALGKKPGMLILMEEEGGSHGAPVYRMAMAEGLDAGAGALAPGELKITRNVRMVYSLK